MGSYGPSPLEALRQAAQIRAFLEDRKYREESQRQRREEYMLEMEDRRRQRALDDFKTTVLLNQMGATPVGPNDQRVESGLDETLGPIAPQDKRTQITAPTRAGGEYYLPSMSESYQRQEQQAARTGKLKGIERRSLEEETDPYTEVDLGPELGGKTQVPKRSVAEVKIRAYQQTHPNLTRETLGPNDDGDYTIILRDPRTQQEVYRQVEKGVGKTARTSADYEAEVVAEEGDRSKVRMRRIQEWMPWAFNQLGIAGDMVDGQFVIGYNRRNEEGKMVPADKETGTAITPDQEDMMRARKLAEDTVDKAMKLEHEGEVAKRKVAGRSRAVSKGEVRWLPAKNVALAARKKRMTIEQFKQWFAEKGGVIR